MQRIRQSGPLWQGGVTVATAVALLATVAPAAGAAGQAPAPTAPAATVPASTVEASATPYVSRPDIAAPPLTTTRTGEETPGYLLLTPGELGANVFQTAMYDNNGELVWAQQPGPKEIFNNLEPVVYRGRPALAYFEGTQNAPGDLTGSRCVILDRHYNEIDSFSVIGHEDSTDSHEVEFSPDGRRVTLLSFELVPFDLSPYGGPKDALIENHVIQEQDIRTGEVTFEWSALDHIPVNESVMSLTEPTPFGTFALFHINSVDYDHDGNLLVSSRFTDTVYKVDHETGEIIWRFGGKSSDFTFADPADMPSGQHDARRLPDGRLSVFDNGPGRNPRFSRGAIYELDEHTMTAELVEDLRGDPESYTPIVGSNRRTVTGNQLVSYGINGKAVEFEDGEPVFTASLPEGYASYRVDRIMWHAIPDAPPDAALGQPAADGSRPVYMSWNGATDVRAWRIEAGPSRRHLRTVEITSRTGFETVAEITPHKNADVYRITALGPFGIPLGSHTYAEDEFTVNS